jgi:uncharacterized protein YbaR (Trm112 family)
MHILLTDILTCPRCGPQFGLVLLADRVEERRVLDGVLGCMNCRERYPIRGGVARFAADRPAPGDADDDAADAADAADADSADSTDSADSADSALRLAALMGVSTGPAYVLLAGRGAAHAPALAELIEHVEVVAVTTGELVGGRPGVNPVTVADRLPFASARLAGVHLGGGAADTLLEEAARVLSPLGRLVLEPAPAGAAERLAAAGLRVLLEEAGTIVAARR